MYINYQLLYEKGLSDEDLSILQKIFQKEEVLLEPFLDHFERFEDLGLIQYLKKKEGTVKGVRISKKGKALLSQLETMGYSDKIGELVDKLVENYVTRNKHVGTKLEVQDRLIWFIGQTGFSTKVILDSVEEYLTLNSEYTKSLENLLWTPSSKAFSVHKNLKDSKLFDFICQKYNLNQTFIIEDKGGKYVKWLADISALTIPKGLPEELYFTGTYKTDLEHIQLLKKMYLSNLKNTRI